MVGDESNKMFHRLRVEERRRWIGANAYSERMKKSFYPQGQSARVANGMNTLADPM
jgi:hypothetical protein